MNVKGGAASCDFKTRVSSRLGDVSKILKLPTDGPLLTLHTNNENSEIRAFPREAFLKPGPVIAGGAKLSIVTQLEVAAANTASLNQRVPNPPAEFKPLPKIEPAKVFGTKRLPGWPVAWSNDKALLFTFNDEMLRPQRIIDITELGENEEPPRFETHEDSEYLQPYSLVAAGLSLNNTYYAVALASRPGVINIYDAKLNRAMYSLTTRQKVSRPITWANFDAPTTCGRWRMAFCQRGRSASKMQLHCLHCMANTLCPLN